MFKKGPLFSKEIRFQNNLPNFVIKFKFWWVETTRCVFLVFSTNMLLYQNFFTRILLIFTIIKGNANYLLSKYWRLRYFSMTSTLHFYVARLWDTCATASWFHPAKSVKYVVVGGQFWRRWKRRRRFGSEGFSCIHGKPSLLQSCNCFIALISEHNQLKFILVGWRWNEGFGSHGFILIYMLVNPWNLLTWGRNKLTDTRQRSEEYLPCQFLHGNQFCVGSFFFPVLLWIVSHTILQNPSFSNFQRFSKSFNRSEVADVFSLW